MIDNQLYRIRITYLSDHSYIIGVEYIPIKPKVNIAIMWKKLLVVSVVFGMSVFILITLSIYSFQRFDTYVRYADAVDHHQTMLTALNKLRQDLIEVETNQRGFLLFNDTSFHIKFLSLVNGVKSKLSTVYDLTKNNTEQLNRVRSLNIAIRSRIESLQSGINVGYPPTDYKVGEEYMNKCISIINDLEISETYDLQEKRDRKKFYENTTPQQFRIAFIFALLIFSVSFGLLLQQYKDRLSYQRRLEENLIELNQSHEEWEQMAYVASHDLQEPLRKIRTFSDMLVSKHSEKLQDDAKNLITRIDHASSRAQSLMADIVNYNMVVFTKEDLQPVPLGKTLKYVLEELQTSLTQKNTEVKISELPTLKGYPSQITLLFKCLIENSLKFMKDDVTGIISISASVVSKNQLPFDSHLSYSHYHKIKIEDNGIGFDNQFSDKIFKMFQRLHPQDSLYEGRGIGLAIVKRIMTNHMGFVVGRGRLNKGAKFTLYFPDH
ncbi:ATP-binding protein [Chryseosolibacter indicus]|uniref:histidine kinase n=1 Tax=Chryseosolibacter indicus TaxID=2782351 RepID=A0ABS5VNK5_9BACT|nr:ATP-binding protein [Chryseosolibacter indicus]MBT1702425.1 CHASE3 domain-containing protein [Chryseosolibacter indicus]